MAYKRELIINNGALTSYKKLLKVSDVCQLLDKSKYPDTKITNGITFTNNGDGTITANGTTRSVRASYFVNEVPAAEGHIYYLTGVDVAVSSSKFFLNSFFVSNTSWLKDNILYAGRGGIIFPYVAGATTIRTQIAIQPNATATNLVFKPQLFDLTEMYGAGNEPATVAEFRQRFPNELYPYSPQCWLTSYKSAVVCKTKNLFDVNNAVPYIFSTDNPNGNLIWLKDGIYTTRINNYSLGSGLRIKNGLSLPAGTYTVSAEIVDFNNVEIFDIGFRYKNTAGEWHAVNKFYNLSKVGIGDIISFAYPIPEHTDLRLYLSYQNNNGAYLTGFVSYKDIQVEQGSTATDYVPYGYL